MLTDLNISNYIFNNLKPAIVICSFITGGPAGILAYKQPTYRVLILTDKYRLSISADFFFFFAEWSLLMR
jgi:hypothetical protein